MHAATKQYLALLLAFVALTPAVPAGAQQPEPEPVPWYKDWRLPEGPKWAITGFYGEGTEEVFSQALFRVLDFTRNDERVVAVTLRRRIGGLTDDITFELEGMYALHYGREDYSEFGVAAYGRWMTFPWNDTVRTTAALGIGPSYTTITPALEKRKHGKSDVRILNQFNVELTAGPPSIPNLDFLLRLQHRSGIGGLISGVEDASNFWSVGALYRF